MVVSLRKPGGSAEIPPFHANLTDEARIPTTGFSRVGVRVANRAIVASIYGAATADALMATIDDRARTFLGARGEPLLIEEDRLDLIVHDHAGDGAQSAAQFVESMVRALGSRAVSCGGVEILPALETIVDDARPEPMRPAASDAGSMAGYAQDMAIAVQTANAIGDGGLFVAWQPVATCAEDATLLHYRAVPQMAESEATEIFTTRLMRAFQRTGLTGLLDSYMVRQTIGQLRKAPTLRLSCRISAASTADQTWWDSIFAALRNEPDVAYRLIVEIDQIAPFPSIAQAVAFTDRLRRLGCHIALDNFGAGQTAIGQLPVLAPDIVIIDDIFLRRPSGFAAVEHLLGFARRFSPVVLVNGVDSEEQARIARAAGADGFAGRFVGAARLTLLAEAPEVPPAIPADPVSVELVEPYNIRALRRGIVIAVSLSALLWWGAFEALRLII
jgi:EAL domain-containing protein (putative c-di-GMP-specific phosphodiesterase class I)